MTVDVTALPPSIALRCVEERIDVDGGAPLRRCLRDSRPGERIALASIVAPGPKGACAESGPCSP